MKGGLRFTTQAAMEDYQRTAVWDVRPPMPFITLAAKLDQRLRALNQGRLWLGGHMRRRDSKSSLSPALQRGSAHVMGQWPPWDG